MTNASGRVRSGDPEVVMTSDTLSVAAANPLFIGSVGKAFAVLQAFTGSKKPLGLSDITAATGLGKSAAQRCCYTLVSLGLLERDPQTRLMRPSVRMLELSYSYLAADPITAIAAPYLLKARESCNQAMNLGIPLDQDIIYIARLRSRQSHIINPIVGGRAPLFCTSSGRAYLSTLEDSAIESIFDASDLSPITRHTITQRDELYKRIEFVRSNGYGLANQECIPGELTIGAPIYQRPGVAVGAINICVSTPSWSMESVEAELAPLITQTAHGISMALSS